MISEKLIAQTLLQPVQLQEKESQVYELTAQFSLHLGYELKIQLDKGDRVWFVDENLMVMNKESGQVQHAVPLQSVIYLSVP